MVDEKYIYLVGLILIIIAYFLGNISPATILAKASGHNIKEEGSGNAGTTNVLRVVGPKAAIITLIIDVFKGFLATQMGYWITQAIFDSPTEVMSGNNPSYALQISAFCGLAVFLGHVFPVLLKFEGGKGVATALGVILATDWRLALICLAAFIAIVIITRMVSLGSIVAAIIFLITYTWKVFKVWGENTHDAAGTTGRIILGTQILAFFIMVVVLIIKHRMNIGRIIRGEENKLSFGKHIK